MKHTKSDYETIRIRMDSMMPDRTNYKQYMLHFALDNVYVEFDVPKEYIVSNENDIVVLTPEGAVFVANLMATKIDELHQSYLENKRS